MEAQNKSVNGALVFGLTLLVGGIAVSGYGYYAVQERAQFDKVGVSTPAAIVDKQVHEEHSDKSDSTSYELKLVYFDTTQKKHEDSRMVSKETYDGLTVGQTTEIKYLPNDTGKFMLTAKQEADNDSSMIGCGGFLAAIGALVGGFSLFKRSGKPQQPATV